MKSRYLAVLAIISAAIGLFLLLSDVVVRDQALGLAALSFFTGSAAFGILLMPRVETRADDAWTKIAWGKFFVATVYASMAVACLVAMAHTPDAVRFAHAVAAAL